MFYTNAITQLSSPPYLQLKTAFLMFMDYIFQAPIFILCVPILVLHCEFTAPELRACPGPWQDRGVHGRGPGSDRIHVLYLYAWCLDARANEPSCTQRCRRIQLHPLPLRFLSCCLCRHGHGAIYRDRRQLRNLPGRSGDPFHCESHDTNTSIALQHRDYWTGGDDGGKPGSW